MTTYLRLRHALVPYIYSCAVRASVDGKSLVEPIYYDHQGKPEAYRYKNTYMFGTEMFVAPITSPRDKSTALGKSSAWLPPGRWVDISTNLVYDGDRTLSFHRPLDKIPCLAREGAIIPQDATELTNGCPIPDNIELTVVVGTDGAFELLEDDGMQDDVEHIRFARTTIAFDQASGTVTIGPTAHPLLKSRTWSIRLPAFRPTAGMTAQAGDVDLSPHAEVRSNETLIHLGLVPATEEIVVNLGADPKLSHNDVGSLVHAALDPMQFEYDVKLVAFEAVQTGGTLNVVASRVESMDLPSEARSALMELLLAESV
jgi:hypothetical protein